MASPADLFGTLDAKSAGAIARLSRRKFAERIQFEITGAFEQRAYRLAGKPIPSMLDQPFELSQPDGPAVRC